MNENYLLTTPLAERLYGETAVNLPLVDYHNHLNVKDLAEDRVFSDIAEVWVLSDPYKHRVMRICGVDEKYITGDVSHKEKFAAWCGTYPRLMGGPLYDWSRMEMEKIFGINTPINASNAGKLWDEANEKLKCKEFSARGLFNHFDVEHAAPCASITDDLTPFKVMDNLAPSLRGDDIACPNASLIEKLSSLTGIEICDMESFEAAVSLRLDAFRCVGCRFSDHALDNGFRYLKDDGQSDLRIRGIIAGAVLPEEDRPALISDMLRMLSRQYAKHGWTMQLHIGAQRFTSSALRAVAGAAGGFAAIGETVNVLSLTNMLDDLEKDKYGLPRTILYTLNPADNAVLAVLSGSFRGVTQGPAWWWCDHLQGMREMLDVFSTFSVLSTFVGMTTDSRSLLSLLRHDYFRRTFCGWVGEKAARGELPPDFDSLSSLVYAVCYGNASALTK